MNIKKPNFTHAFSYFFIFFNGDAYILWAVVVSCGNNNNREREKKQLFINKIGGKNWKK